MRPLRIEFPGALYHVTARGNVRQAIVLDDADRDAFLAILAKAVGRFGLLCHAYCLMDNHYHLILETPRANLSAALHFLNGVYAQSHNRRHRQVGHLFQGRFKAILVEKEPHLLELARYVVLNPVRARACTKPEEWPWSSYRATAGEAPVPGFLSVAWLLAQLSPGRPQAQARYREFVAAAADPDPFADLRGQIYLGSEGFVRGHVGERDTLQDIPRPHCQPLRPALAEMLAAGGDEAIALAARTYGYRLREIADHLGVHRSTISRRLARLEAETRHFTA